MYRHANVLHHRAAVVRPGAFAALLALALWLGSLGGPPRYVARGDALLPSLASLSPATAPAGGQGFTLIVNGSGFLDTATVLWNGSPRSTSIVSPAQLTAAIPAGDLAIAAPIATVDVAVDNNDGSGPSAPLAFVISGPSVLAAQSTVVPPAGAGALSLASVGGAGGLSGTLVNGGGRGFATLTFASYAGNPTSVSVFAPGALFFDVHVAGTALAGSLTATFQFPSGSPFVSTLFFFDSGARAFLPLRGSGQALGSYVVNQAAGTITVIFDGTSVPALGNLTGTVIAADTLTATGSAAPTAVADTYTTPVNTALAIAAPGVLANDVPVAADPLNAVLTAGPVNGALTFNADGSFVYTPNANFSGIDSFSYVAHDTVTGLDSAAALVSIGVGVSLPQNPPLNPAAFGVVPQAAQAGGAGGGGVSPLPVVIFVPIFTLTVDASGCGSVSPGAGPHAFGDTITLTATPCAGSTFALWSGGPCAGSAINPCAVVMPPTDLTITAVFQP